MLTKLSTLQSNIRKYNLRLVSAAGCRGAWHMAANAARAMRLTILAAVVAPLGSPSAELALFESQKLTQSEYTPGIEGPAVDAAGTLYLMNFHRPRPVGKVNPRATQTQLFAPPPPRSARTRTPFD